MVESGPERMQGGVRLGPGTKEGSSPLMSVGILGGFKAGCRGNASRGIINKGVDGCIIRTRRIHIRRLGPRHRATLDQRDPNELVQTIVHMQEEKGLVKGNGVGTGHQKGEPSRVAAASH
jgi:hypothetical protein